LLRSLTASSETGRRLNASFLFTTGTTPRQLALQ
jgi:hypothetical protein